MKSFRMGFKIAAGAYVGWNVAQALDRNFGKVYFKLKQTLNNGDEA